MKFYTHEEMLDKHIGEKGTDNRESFDKEIEKELKENPKEINPYDIYEINKS